MSGPTYTYTSDTPQASTPINVTQPLILSNFQAINELIGVDHVTFNQTNSGMHNTITMPFQSSIPTTASTDFTMYTAATPSGPNAGEIYVAFPSNSESVQISNVSTGGTVPSGTAGTGWCLFDSGVLMKWGTGTVTTIGFSPYYSGSSVSFYFPTGTDIPVFSTTNSNSSIAYVKITPTTSPGDQNFGAVCGIGYSTRILVQTIYPTTFSFNWFAIGAN